MTPQMTRDEWLRGLWERAEPVGECLEWQGPKLGGKTPLAYVPRGYLVPEWSQSRQSCRTIFWMLAGNPRPLDGHVLRTSCRNDACVLAAHIVLIPRTRAPREQARRGEFATPKRTAAAIARARRRPTKLSLEIVREIRSSPEAAKVLAARYGVSRASINSVRSGRLWPEAANGSSVFSWRPAT